MTFGIITRTMKNCELYVCILSYLYISASAWPKHGRSHPLYNGRQQTNGNILANAFLLGLDYKDVQLLHAMNGQGIGSGPLDPNIGFPINAHERRRASQDIEMLNALGIIDTKEAEKLTALINEGAPDPPDKVENGNNIKEKGTTENKNVVKNAKSDQTKIQMKKNANVLKHGQKLGVKSPITRNDKIITKENASKTKKIPRKKLGKISRKSQPEVKSVKTKTVKNERKGKGGGGLHGGNANRPGGNYESGMEPGENEAPVQSSSGGETQAVRGAVINKRLKFGRFSFGRF